MTQGHRKSPAMTLKAMLLPTFNGQAGPSNASSTGPSRRKLISLAVACSAAYFVWTLAVPGVSGDEATPSPDGGSTPAQVAGQSRWTSWGWASPSKWGSGTHDAHHTTPLSGGLTADPSTWESPTRPLPLEASLDERLRSWSDAPIPEPADWVRFSLNTCPEKRIGKNGNYELLKVGCSSARQGNLLSVFTAEIALVVVINKRDPCPREEGRADLVPASGRSRGQAFRRELGHRPRLGLHCR